MKRSFIHFTLYVMIIYAQEMLLLKNSATKSYNMPEIQVIDRVSQGQSRKSNPIGYRHTFSKESIQTFGAAAGTSPYKVLTCCHPSTPKATIPSLGAKPELLAHPRPARRYGQKLFADDQRAAHPVAMGHGIMGNLVDTSKLHSLSLYKGPVPADAGFGFGNTSGALDSEHRGAAEQFGASIEQKVGSLVHAFVCPPRFRRLADHGTRVFGSVSYAREDKWRGTGEINNFNLMGGIAQPLFEDRVKVEVYESITASTRTSFGD